MSSGHTLKLWFNPKHGWRAKSYDQRYPGCTRQQEHRVYTADDVSLPDLLKNPNNLNWLSDPKQAKGKALYVGQLGLPGGMPPSKHVVSQAKGDLSAIAVQATEQGKIGALRRALDQAQEGADFDDIYEQVFGEGSSEASDLAIFDLTVGEVQELPNYKEIALDADAEDRIVDLGEDVLVDPRAADAAVMSPSELVKALYSPVESANHQAACKLLKSKKYEAAYSAVLPFTAGLLYKRYIDGKDAEAHGLHVFWHYVLSDPRELVGIHQIALNMRCIEACDADAKGVLEKLHRPILDDITSWVLAAWDVETVENLTPALLPVLESVWGACPRVLSYKTLVEGVLNKLQNWNKTSQVSEKVALGTLGTLARLFDAAWPSAIRTALLKNVLAGCKHESPEVRKAAARGLSQALGSKCSEEAWKAILEILKGLFRHNRDVREAAEGLSKALEGACSEEVWTARVATLTCLCEDDSEWVRKAAARGLSQALGGNCSEEICNDRVETLTRLCKDKNWNVREAAAGACSQALVNCSEKAWNAILEDLKRLCKDDSGRVRKAATRGLSQALESQCSDDARKAIIETLMNLCKDDFQWVREVATRGLSQALESQCSDDTRKAIIETLMHLCKDVSGWVRKAAARACSQALETQRSEQAWQGIVEALTSLCKDEDWSVREAAAGDLSRVLKNQCSDDVGKAIIETLMHLCKDDFQWVRKAAARACSQALETQRSEQAWQGIVEALTSLCKDEDWSVREAAAISLSKALEGAASEQTWKRKVEVMASLCKDEDWSVRYAAAGACSKALKEASSEQAWLAIVEILTGLCKDEDWIVRYVAAGAYSQGLQTPCSGEARHAIVEMLKSLCKDEHCNVREAATGGLSKALERECSEQDRHAIVEILTSLCKDSDSDVRKEAYSTLVQLLCSGHGDETILKQAFTTLSKSLGYGGFWDIPGPVYASLHALLFGSRINDKLRAKGWCMLCEGCKDKDSDMRCSAVEPLSTLLLKSGLPGKEFKEGLLVLFKARLDGDSRVQSIADRSLVQLMAKHKDLLLAMLMSSESSLSTSVEATAVYSPCLLLPDQCDQELCKEVEQSFAQERKKRGWPEVLLGVENLPSVPLPEEDSEKTTE